MSRPTIVVAELAGLVEDFAARAERAAAAALAASATTAEFGYSGIGTRGSIDSMVLSELAREELLHYEAVLALLRARGIRLGPPLEDRYAALLRKACQALPRDASIPVAVDRLVVAAHHQGYSATVQDRIVRAADAGEIVLRHGRQRRNSNR